MKKFVRFIIVAFLLYTLWKTLNIPDVQAFLLQWFDNMKESFSTIVEYIKEYIK